MSENLDQQVGEMVDELLTRQNILLEGPPGTGKTYQVMSIVEEMSRRVSNPNSGGKPVVRTRNPQFPLGSTGGMQTAGERQAVRTEWVTFHESFTYEEFILGRRPEPRDGVVRLVAHAGILLDLAISVDANIGDCESAVLIVDEINRANAGRVLGEFMTFMDPSYRSTVNGQLNSRALRPRLAGLRYGPDGDSEEIVLLNGRVAQLPKTWLFPENVYVIATMNSVDKGALPLDSALLRRFKRFFISPSSDVLAEYVRTSSPDCDEQLLRLICALLDQVNQFVLACLGRDHLLGHALFWDVVKDGKCTVSNLARVWDRVLFPQLLDKFAFNIAALGEFLQRNLETTDGLLDVQRVSVWDPLDALAFFEAIADKTSA